MKVKEKISYFKKLRIFCIVATPRSGSDYFQSLLDGHPEVLTFNGSVGLYVGLFPKINFNNANKQNINLSITKFINIYHDWLCTKNDNSEGKNKMGKSKNEFININLNRFKYAMFNYLNLEGFTKKNFSLAVYFAYNIALGLNFKNKKILLMHPHNLDELVHFSKDFRKSKYIFTIRDQRAAYLSTIYNLADRYPNRFFNLRHHYITMYRCLVHSNYGEKLKLKYTCIRLEDLPHKKTLFSISKFLNIKFKNSLLVSTFAGKIWNGDSSQKKIYKDKWKKNRTYNNWKEKIKKRDKLILNTLFFPILKHYNYEKVNVSCLDYLKCFIFIYLPMEFEIKVLKKNILSIISKKGKIKQLGKFLENLYFFLRRVLICLKFYLFNLFNVKKINSKYIKIKILDKTFL